MLITGVSHVYIYVWTPSTEADNFLFVAVAKDPELCEKMLEKFNTLFMKCIFPELITRRTDPSNENNDQFSVFAEGLAFHQWLHATTETANGSSFIILVCGLKKYQREDASAKIVKR